MGEKKRETKKSLQRWGKEEAVKPQEAPRRKIWEPVVTKGTSRPKPPVGDSGHGDATPPEASNPREQAAAAASGSKRCVHYSRVDKQLGLMLRAIRSPRYSAICELCRGKEEEETGVMVCLHCAKYCCTLRRHALQHANKERHWLAISCSEPYAPFCFKCDKEKSIKVRKEQTAWAIPVKDDAGDRVSGSANGHGNPVRGIPNRGRTCYVNALVQCLLALHHMRVWMLGQNAPTSPIGMALKELFAAANNVGGELKPDKLLARIRKAYPQLKGDQDSHELLCCLRSKDLQEGAPAVIDSIFGGQMSVTRSCNCCISKSVSHVIFLDLSVALPSKGCPDQCVSSPPRNRSCKSQQKSRHNLISAIEMNKMEKIQTMAEGGDSQNPGSELKHVVMDKTPEHLEVGKFMCYCT